MHPLCRIISKFRSMAFSCFGNFFTYALRKTFPPILPNTYKIQLPISPPATETAIVNRKLSFPFAAHIPANGIITPAGNPGRFIYSNITTTNTAIAPKSSKQWLIVSKSILSRAPRNPCPASFPTFIPKYLRLFPYLEKAYLYPLISPPVPLL